MTYAILDYDNLDIIETQERSLIRAKIIVLRKFVEGVSKSLEVESSDINRKFKVRTNFK